MVNNFAARKAVEKTRGGKVKNRLSHIVWKSRQHPRDSHFPTASAASVYVTNSYRTEGDISNEVSLGTFLKRYDKARYGVLTHSSDLCIIVGATRALHTCEILRCKVKVKGEACQHDVASCSPKVIGVLGTAGSDSCSDDRHYS